MIRIFIPLILIFICHQAFASSPVLINMGSDFKEYVKQYRNSSPVDQWQGWKSFESKYQIQFDSALCDSEDPDCEDIKKNRLKDFFIRLPSFEAAMWSIFDNAESLTASQMQQFKKMFPDLPDDVPVVFMPSLLTFNGKGGVQINGRYTLVIGADFAAFRGNNIKVLFSHEFFHTYQFAKIATAKYQTLASPLWFEGFAVWVSRNLVPEASDTDILMNQNLADYCSSAESIKQMAQSYLPLLNQDYSANTSSEIKSDWFYGNGKVSPQRRGYCLGYKAIQNISAKHSLSNLTGLGESSFIPLLEEALKELGDSSVQP